MSDGSTLKLARLARELHVPLPGARPELPFFHRASIPRSGPAPVGALLYGLVTDAASQCSFVQLDGALLLDFRPQMDAVVRITSWEDGLRTWRLVSGCWVEEWHDWQLAFVSEALRRTDHPGRDLALTVPKDAASLATVAGGYEITALRLLRRHPQAWEFARSAPNLFWLLCAHLGDLNEPTGADFTLFEIPRTALLQMCVGVPVRQAGVRFIERFRPRDRSDLELRLLRRGVRPSIIHLMRHCTQFGPWMLRHAVRAADLDLVSDLVSPCDSSTSSAFFADVLRLCSVASEAGRAFERDDAPMLDACVMADDAFDLAQALGLGEDDAEALLQRLPSVKKLRAVHDELAARLNAEFPDRARQRLLEADPLLLDDDDGADDEALPESGLADTRDIQAMRTVGEVRAEGREMGHCVGVYVGRCRRAESFIFRVLRPSRATLEIQVHDGRLVIAQLKGAHNSEPAAETVASAERWLAGC